MIAKKFFNLIFFLCPMWIVPIVLCFVLDCYLSLTNLKTRKGFPSTPVNNTTEITLSSLTDNIANTVSERANRLLCFKF